MIFYQSYAKLVVPNEKKIVANVASLLDRFVSTSATGLARCTAMIRRASSCRSNKASQNQTDDLFDIPEQLLVDCSLLRQSGSDNWFALALR
jgi:hypothetical protein